MRHPAQRLGRAVFGAAVLAALGFGATQALAATADSTAATARACSHSVCNNYCIGAGYYGGSCIGNPGKCLCY